MNLKQCLIMRTLKAMLHIVTLFKMYVHMDVSKQTNWKRLNILVDKET